MRFQKIIILLIASFVLTSTSIAFANEEDSKSRIKDEKREQYQEKKEEKIEKVCENVEKRIDERVNRFDNNKEEHIKRYNNVKEKLQNIVSKLEEKGYDVSALKEDLQTLDIKIKKFAADYATYINKFKEARSYACGNSEGNFKSKMEEVRKALQQVKADAQDIREFYNSDIKEDLKDLREQKENKE